MNGMMPDPSKTMMGPKDPLTLMMAPSMAGPMTTGPMAQPDMMEGMEYEQQPPNLLQMLQGPNANQILQVLLEALQQNQAPQAAGLGGMAGGLGMMGGGMGGLGGGPGMSARGGY